MRNQNTRSFSGPRRREREVREYEEKVLALDRVARVVSGGKRFKFRAAVAIGNRKGKVGFGVGKGVDVAQAVAKASHQAKKNIVETPLGRGTIPFEIKVKFNSAMIFLKPAPPGRGINAGGAVRAISELAGYKDIIAKILSRSGNKINNARAALKAFRIIAAKSHKS